MGRKLIVALIAVSMLLSIYSSTLVIVSSADETTIAVLDVCSTKMKAGFMAPPTVPEPVFTFSPHKPSGQTFTEDKFLISFVHLAVPKKPPIA